MNWLLLLVGFVVGMFFGANISIFVVGMCAAAHYGDRFMRSQG